MYSLLELPGKVESQEQPPDLQYKMLLVREGIMTVTNCLCAVHKGLEDPASARHFIRMFVFFSVASVGSVVFILGQGEEEREKAGRATE